MTKIRNLANAIVTGTFLILSAGFAVGTLIFLGIALYRWLFTDGYLVATIARAVGCLFLALLFKVLARFDEYEPVPDPPSRTRRPTRKT